MDVYFRFFSQLAHMDFNHEESTLSSSTCSCSSSFSVAYSWEDSSSQPTTTTTTVETSSFITNNEPKQKQENDDLDSLSCNQRNKDWIMNTLRILQMMTKGKPLRNRTLANYKAFVCVESGRRERRKGGKGREKQSKKRGRRFKIYMCVNVWVILKHCNLSFFFVLLLDSFKTNYKV